MPNKELTVACQQRKVRSVCLQTFLLLFGGVEKTISQISVMLCKK